MLYLKKTLITAARQLSNSRIKHRLSVFLFLSLFLFLSNAEAGFIFKFNPFFTSEARYDDNLFTTRSDTISDWITTVSPGFITSLSHPRFNYKLKYQPGFVYYLHNPELDYDSQEVDFRATIELTSRLTFSFYDRYIRSNQIRFEELSETDYEREVRRTTLTTFNRNIISPKLKYRFGRENFISLYYRNTGYRSGLHSDDDYREQYVESEMEYWFNVRNAINLTCHFLKGNFDLDTDLLSSVDITTRYIRRFTPHFVLYGEYGVGVTDFEERRTFESLTHGREFQVDSQDVEDYDLRKFNLGFVWQLPRNFQIEGFVGYYWRQGVGNRDDQGTNSSIEIEKTTRDFNLNLGWERGYSADFFSISDTGFSESWRLFCDVRYNYHKRLELRFRGSYGFREFTDRREGTGSAAKDREDYRYAARTLLTYHIVRNYFFLRDLSFEMQFNHVELDSSLDTRGYINNQFTVKITATF